MATKTEQAQVDVIINGSKATSTIAEMEKATKVLNAQLRNLTPGTKEFIEKSKQLQEVKGKLDDVKKSATGTSSAMKGLVGEASKFGPIGSLVGGVTGAFSSLKGGLTTVTGSFRTLGGAIMATGIGALVIAVITLVTWFAKTDAGAAKLEGIMRALGGTVDILASRLMNIGKTMKDFFSDPVKFFKDLASDIKTAVNTGMELAEMFDKLDDQRREMELTTAKNDALITELLIKSKNRTLAEQERIKLLDEASKKEQENLEIQLQYARMKQNLLLIEMQMAEKAGTQTDEQADKLNEANIAIINLQKDSLKLTESINNRKAALQKELYEENAKLNENRVKDEEKTNKAIEKADEKSFEERQKQLEIHGKKMQKAAQEAAKQEFEEKKRAAMAAIDLEIIQAEGDPEKVAELKRKRSDLERADALGQAGLLQEEIDLINAQFDKKNKDQAQADEDAARELKKAKASADLEFASHTLDTISKISTLQTEKELRDSEMLKNQKIKNLNDGLKAGKISQEAYDKALADNEVESEKRTNEIRTRQAKAEKQTSLAQAIIAGALAVIKASPNPIGMIAATVAGGIAVAKISGTPIPEFAQGGFTGEGLHKDRTGKRVAGVVHENEWVAPDWMTQRYPGMFDNLENVRLRGFAEGGFTSSPSQSIGSSVSPSTVNAESQQMKAELSRLSASIDRLQNIRAYVVHQDIEDADATINTIRNEANIG